MEGHEREDGTAERGLDVVNPSLTRRRVLQSGVAAAAALAIPGGLGSMAAAATPQPKRGGRLRTAQVGGGTAEGLDPFASTDFITAARSRQLYNTLMKPST